jgi:aminopeptidase N
LIIALGYLNDPGIIAGCRERFQKYVTEPASLPPDLRRAIFSVVGRYADETTWNNLHTLGFKTTSIEEKQNYYDALAHAVDPKLVNKTLQIALTDELPTSRAIFLVGKVARYSDHPDIAWQFAKTNMKALLAKADALAINSYAPSLFTFFSDPAHIEELKAYAKANLPASSAKEVAKAVEEIEFRSAFKGRLAPQLAGWVDSRTSKK